jgi:hypothetical protein
MTGTVNGAADRKVANKYADGAAVRRNRLTISAADIGCDLGEFSGTTTCGRGRGIAIRGCPAARLPATADAQLPARTGSIPMTGTRC